MNQHVMNIMDSSGHTTVTWDPDNAVSVADARTQFADLIRQGYSAFRMNVSHEGGAVTEAKGERIETFDPQAGKVMMVPHRVGG